MDLTARLPVACARAVPQACSVKRWQLQAGHTQETFAERDGGLGRGP